MLPIIQTGIACLLIIWFLPKLKTTNGATANMWGFLLLFSIATALQVDFIYARINELLRINHVAWLLGYALGAVALYLAYRGLRLVLDPDKPKFDDRLYYFLLFILLSLIVLFPAMVDYPADVKEIAPDSLWSLLFIVIPYTYGAVLTFVLARILYQCQNANKALHVRLRWILLSVSVFLGTVYYVIRAPYFIVVFWQPNFLDTPLARLLQIALNFLLLTRVSWVFFFVPTKVYEVVCRPLVLLDKLVTLRQLEALQAELDHLMPQPKRLSVNYSPVEKIQNLDFLLYRTLISLLDGKKFLRTLFTETNSTELIDRRLLLLYERLGAVEDDRDFDTLITAYRQIARGYRSQLVLMR